MTRTGIEIPVPSRHALVYTSVAGWAELLAERPDLTNDPLVATWASRGHPVMARRRAPGDKPDHMAVGLPLPPSEGKRRLALGLRPEAIRAIAPPPRLIDVRAAAPAAWWPMFDRLAALGRDVGREPRVFGSFAWAALTGLPYVTATSDLDLLWPLDPAIDVGALLSALSHLEGEAPGRLDGEVVRQDNAMAVNWRELYTGGDEVLVKTIDSVALRPASWFVGGVDG